MPKKICQKFKDVLPTETIGEEDLLLGMADVKVPYNGPRHPESPMEQLDFDLVSLVNKSSDLESMVREMENIGQGSSRCTVYRRV
ncbi:hypothetical protein PVAP13_3NG177700 [Panicum virgatum]|uniref:Uncharacterized protein n=1 Tax=Panicum virgatum TaxID=38727 RepID=A0A8T0UJW9_PANVG|nr:hypothetical protein PVAP13_3NG177700 [Panicum virgatum]